MKTAPTLNAERTRLEAQRAGREDWRLWGPYLAERAWGTVREDYSPHGNAWEYFDHDQARSRAYRWNEDGIGGICDEDQHLCFALALWNGRDPILKERAFGLTGNQGNHGEDVKEYYFYLDATPSHSYLRYLYKYPQAEYPYARLVEENARRSRNDPPFSLLDAGVFDDGRYWDVEVRYAKAGPEEIHIRVIATNRGPETAMLHLLPTLWFRNTWSWGNPGEKPVLAFEPAPQGAKWAVKAEHPALGEYFLYGAPRSDASLHRERKQRRAPVGRAKRRPVRERCVPPPRDPRRGRRSQPGPHRHQVRSMARAHRRAGPRRDHRHDPLQGRARGALRQARSDLRPVRVRSHRVL